MIEPPKFNTIDRKKYDLKDLDTLATEVVIYMDASDIYKLKGKFDILLKSAGTMEFLGLFLDIQRDLKHKKAEKRNLKCDESEYHSYDHNSISKKTGAHIGPATTRLVTASQQNTKFADCTIKNSIRKNHRKIRYLSLKNVLLPSNLIQGEIKHPEQAELSNASTVNPQLLLGAPFSARSCHCPKKELGNYGFPGLLYSSEECSIHHDLLVKENLSIKHSRLEDLGNHSVRVKVPKAIRFEYHKIYGNLYSSFKKLEDIADQMNVENSQLSANTCFNDDNDEMTADSSIEMSVHQQVETFPVDDINDQDFSNDSFDDTFQSSVEAAKDEVSEFLSKSCNDSDEMALVSCKEIDENLHIETLLAKDRGNIEIKK